MSTAAGFPLTPREPALLRLGAARLTLLQVDLAVITLWFVVTPVQFKYDELLLYPMALYFVFAFFRDRHATWPVFKRGFVLLLLPGWWLLSATWSPDPAQAAKSGLQVVLTIMICMFMASRLTMRQLMIVLLISIGVIAIISLPYGLIQIALNKPFKSLYPHKNSFGTDMSVLWIVTLGLLFSVGVPRLIRLVTIGLLPISILMVFASKSATAILISVGMAGIVLGALIYFGRSNLLTLPRVGLIALTIAVISAGFAVIISVSPVDPIDLVLNALGKDRGLTGRTDLWAMALREIEERPLFGTGAWGFWRYEDSPFVRQVFIDFYKKAGNRFHFHNSWLELAVNLGLIGAGLAVAGFAWAFGVLVRRALKTGGAQNWALLAIACAILARTMTEADLFVQFVMLHMLLWTGVLIIDPACDMRERSG